MFVLVMLLHNTHFGPTLFPLAIELTLDIVWALVGLLVSADSSDVTLSEMFIVFDLLTLATLSLVFNEGE